MTTAQSAPPGSRLHATATDTAGLPDFSFEERFWQNGHARIAGVDEAGRGPLAGPVVAAAVILEPGFCADGLNDSKKLTAKARNRLYEAILASATAVSVASLCAQSIDASDIRKASLAAMRNAVQALSPQADSALIDGRDIPPGLHLAATPLAIVKGDGRSLSIAAASIVAKVTRDRMMQALSVRLPDYGFERHMGYGSKLHRDAIARAGGAQRVHRFSFRPLKDQ
ncbi:ribonuclease HII [Oricola sp.]|uniref:ribonuclease HII n=1 Tax=Oricola sp. TaxID=1979950 RepID=UPI003BA92BE4